MPFYRQGLCKNAGPQILRQRLRVIYDTSFHCASLLAVFPSDWKSHDFPVPLYLLIISAFLSAPDLWPILHCAGNAPVNLHQNPRSFAYCTRPVRHFRRAKRQSDAQPPHRAIPLSSGFRRSFPNLTRLFMAAVSNKKEKKIDTEGGMMPRRIPCSRRQPVPRTV